MALVGLALAMSGSACGGRAAPEPPDPARIPPSLSGFNGLLELDTWTEALLERPAPAAAGKAEPVARVVERALEANRVDDDLDELRLTQELTRKLAYRRGPAEHARLLEGLLVARARIGADPKLPLPLRRKALTLLGLLAQEAIHALAQSQATATAASGTRSPARASAPLVIAAPVSPAAAPEACAGRLHGVPVCAGDLALTQGGSFAQLVFMIRQQHPSLFSHARLLLPAPAPGHPHRVATLESDFPGTLASSGFEGEAHPVIAIYRSKRAGAAGRRALAERIEARLRSVLGVPPTGGALPEAGFEAAAGSFNFTFRKRCGAEGTFCSELASCVFDEAGLTGERNPYPEALWSPQRASSLQPSLAAATSADAESYGVPGDLEVNPEFEPVAWIIRPERIAAQRIAFAANSAFLSVVESAPEWSDLYLSLFARPGSLTTDDRSPGRWMMVTRAMGVELGSSRPGGVSFKPRRLRISHLLVHAHLEDHILAGARRRLAEELGPRARLSRIQAQAVPRILFGMSCLIAQRAKPIWAMRIFL